MHQSTLPSGGVAWILRLGVAAGGDEATLLAQAGIRAEALARPDDRIARTKSLTLWRAIAELIRDPTLPVRYGQNVIPESLGVLGYLLRQSPTLGHLLRTIEQFQRLTQSQAPIRVWRRGERLSVSQQLFPEEVALVYPPEFVVSSFTGMVRAVLGDSWSPAEVFFQHGRAPWVAAIRGVFRCPVRFNATSSGISIHAADQALTLRERDPYLHAYLYQVASTVLETLPRRPPWTAAVLRRLAELEPSDLPDLTRMSRTLGMSGRTLQRRLRAEGQRYRELVEGVRIDHAKRHLATTRRSVTEIAARLGYAGVDTFSRAFHRWTGLAPLAWRRQMVTLSSRASSLSRAAKA